eukprot:9410347-Ditylum_brightwellii.AAC.1
MIGLQPGHLLDTRAEYAHAQPHTQHISGGVAENYGTITDAFAAHPVLLGYVDQEYGKAVLEYNKTGNPNNLKQKYNTDEHEEVGLGPDIPITDQTIKHHELEGHMSSLLYDDDTFMSSIDTSSTHTPTPFYPSEQTHTPPKPCTFNTDLRLVLLLSTYPEYAHIIKCLAAKGQQPSLIATSIQALAESAEADDEL